ncbi:MAG: hypothetical protein KF799_13465 [Bdellovibrionales bacterium]|nr:hypothetical protein [Bdellovibrionales bacterium]
MKKIWLVPVAVVAILCAILVNGWEAKAALTAGEVESQRLQGNGVVQVSPMLEEKGVAIPVPLNPKVQTALKQMLQGAGLRNGVFVVNEEGELFYIGQKADLNALRKGVGLSGLKFKSPTMPPEASLLRPGDGPCCKDGLYRSDIPQK